MVLYPGSFRWFRKDDWSWQRKDVAHNKGKPGVGGFEKRQQHACLPAGTPALLRASQLKEGHACFKHGSKRMLSCYYGQREDIPSFKRRIYWRLDVPKAQSYILVHYRNQETLGLLAPLPPVQAPAPQLPLPVSVGVPVTAAARPSTSPSALPSSADKPKGLLPAPPTATVPLHVASSAAAPPVLSNAPLHASPTRPPALAGEARELLADDQLSEVPDTELADLTLELLQSLVMQLVQLAHSPADPASAAPTSTHLLEADDGGATLLHHVASCGLKDLVGPLLRVGLHIDEQDNAGRTPLLVAAAWGQAGAVAELASQGADLLAEDEDGQSASALALRGGHEQLGQLLAECQQEAQVAAQGAAGSPTAPFQPLAFQPPAAQEAASPSPAKRLRPTVEDWEDVWSGDLDVDFADDVAIPLATETDEATPSRRPPPLPAAAEPALPDLEQDMAALRQEWKDKLSKVSALQVGQAPATREASLGLLQQLRRLPMPAQVSGLPDIPESTGTPLQALDQANMLLSVLGEGTLAERVSMHLALAPSLPSVVTASSAAPSLHYQDSDTGSHRPQRSPFMSFDPDAVQPPPLGGAGQSLGSVGDGVESLGGMSSCSGQASVGFDDARLGVTNADVLSVISGGALASEGGAGRHAPPTPLSDGRRLPPAREGMSHADAVKMYHCMSPEEQEAVDGEVARIQRNVRAWLVLRNYRNIRGAITSLQAYTRCALARKKFAAAKQATVAVQSQWRGRQARDALRQAQAALVIQRSLRNYLAQPTSSTAPGGLPPGAEGGGAPPPTGGRKRSFQ